MAAFFVFFIGLGCAALGLWLISIGTRTVRTLVRIPLLPVRDVKAGERVRVRGALRSDTPVRAFLVSGDAALVRTTVEEVVATEGRRRELRPTRTQLSAGSGLWLDDGSGRVRVSLDGATVRPSVHKVIVSGTMSTPEAEALTTHLGLSGQPGRRITEEVIPSGTEVLVVGMVREDAGEPVLGGEGSELWGVSDEEIRSQGSSERVMGWVLLIAGTMVLSVAIRLWDRLVQWGAQG